MLPRFLGIGAQKAATSWLARNLAEHPAIWMPPIKEIHYFDRPANWRDPVRHYVDSDSNQGRSRGTAWDLKYDRVPRDDDWYSSLFEPAPDQIAGEITPGYSTLDSGEVGRVHALLPEAKILLMLRNPIERVWSQTMMYLARRNRPLPESDGELRDLLRLPRVRALTEYPRTIDTWSERYPRFFIGFIEDVSFAPRELLFAVHDFLGVSRIETPSLRRLVYSHAPGQIPVDVARMLALEYRDQIVELERRLGSYASFWRYCAERLLDVSPGESHLRFPLWRSELWEEWVSDRPISVG